MAGLRRQSGDLDADLARLERATAAELRQMWSPRRGAPPPATLSARVMRLALAWERQAAVEGDECPATRRAWAAVLARREKGAAVGSASTGAVPRAAPVGTRILKSWGGETHEVVVLGDGAWWRGRSYGSLSAVARAMTGTPRNGPRFFGLREGVR